MLLKITRPKERRLNFSYLLSELRDSRLIDVRRKYEDESQLLLTMEANEYIETLKNWLRERYKIDNQIIKKSWFRHSISPISPSALPQHSARHLFLIKPPAL